MMILERPLLNTSWSVRSLPIVSRNRPLTSARGLLKPNSGVYDWVGVPQAPELVPSSKVVGLSLIFITDSMEARKSTSEPPRNRRALEWLS